MRIPYRVMAPSDEVKRYVLAALEAGTSYGGEETQRFEVETARWCGRRYGVSANSGTSVTQMALEASGVGPGTEVILPANGYVGVVAPVIKLGATPVFADVDPDTANLIPEAVRAACTPRTRAVVPTDMYGFPADMDGITEAARAAGAFVLEDAAHALGAEYKGRPAGGLGDAGFFSFSGKMITVFGSGGMLVTDDAALAEGVSSLRDQGRVRARELSFVRRVDAAWYDQTAIGYNMHLTEMCAAAGRVELRALPAYVAHRRRNAAHLTARLRDAGLPLQLPPERSWAAPCHLHYVVYTPHRDALSAFLRQQGIGTSIHYPAPLHLLAPVRERFGTREGQFPAAERLCRENLSLPVGPHVSTSQIDEIADGVIAFFAGGAGGVAAAVSGGDTAKGGGR